MINRKFYFDNYYTTIRLLVELKKIGLFSTGTVRSNRLHDVTMIEPKQLSIEGRGSIDHRTTTVDDVSLCATRWFDNSAVNCLSTWHGNECVDTVQRWSAREKKYVQVKRPNVIKIYNQFKDGVDLLDMLISLYRTSNFYRSSIHSILDWKCRTDRDVPILVSWVFWLGDPNIPMISNSSSSSIPRSEYPALGIHPQYHQAPAVFRSH